MTEKNIPEDPKAQNILAAKIVADTVRTTLGPKGMDKMLVNKYGDVTVTNDGVTILNEMEIQHPAAKMLVEVAKTQEEEIGDGTTTAVIFAGELLKKAELLLEKRIHPTIICKGYRDASIKAQEYLKQVARPFTGDPFITRRIAMTAMTGKGAEQAKEHLSSLIEKAVTLLGKSFSRKQIHVEKVVGGSVDDSKLVEGLIVDREKCHSAMPLSVEGKIALLNTPIEVKDMELEAKINLNTPEQMQNFLAMEEEMVEKLVNKIVGSGANAVFCQKGIDDLAQYLLASKGIYACRRVPQSTMSALSKATGAKILSSVKDLKEEYLGEGLVEEVLHEDPMTYVKGKNPEVVTILIKGATEHSVMEVKRAVEDAIGDIASAVKSGQVVEGAGKIEVMLYHEMNNYASKLSGKEQLAVKAFAESFEIIPQTLAENAGLDPIDVVAKLKAEKAGINVFTGNIMSPWEEGVIEPVQIKTQAISSATEVAVMILRIDDVIAMKGKED